MQDLQHPKKRLIGAVVLLLLTASSAWAQPADPDEPALPAGLDDDEPALPSGLDDDEPALPSGLGDGGGGGSEPALPSGLGNDIGGSADTRSSDSWSSPVQWRAVFDMRAGTRTQSDANEDQLSLGELRLQLDSSKSWRPWSTRSHLVVDAIYDQASDTMTPDLESGAGALDLRVASVVTSPTSFMDVKVGRQILTWGTGDLLFINDLFPKDWTAFLIGRDIEYLKAPSDALKVALFSETISADFIVTPRFDADRWPLRDRLSSWDPATQRIAGRETPIDASVPDRWFKDAELAARLYRNVAAFELAAYAYRGFWKSPAGADAITGQAIFPALSVYGASVRGPMFGGIVNTEGGYFDSRDDRGGDNPLLRNSEARGMVGFERQLTVALSAGAQYYVEYMMHHGRYLASSPPMAATADRARHVASLRLRWLAMQQNLQATVIIFASPTDADAYLRPSIQYNVDDNWRLGLAANLMRGRRDDTFFGQLENNSNVLASLRYAR